MPKLPKGMGKAVIIGAVLLAVIGLGSTTFYTVQEQERAAIMTFGKFTGEEKAGLHFKLPYPIQDVIKVPAEITQRIHIGYIEKNGKDISEEGESLMITGDENIVSADAVVEWKIGNIEKYLYNIEEPELFLRNASIAAIRTVIGSTKLDSAITDGKTEVQIKVKEKLDELNNLYDTGILIQDIKFQDIEPPEGEVSNAFKEVTNAREEKNTKINNAKKYENDIIPKARGEAQAILENAEAVKKSRILNAQGDVAKFNAVQQEYAKSPSITENRLILETLEKILPNAKIIISDNNDSTVKYFPVNDLLKGSAKGATTTP
ncbi:FtsH protease activity modulator HflK [Paenibacillus albiflavus]|uniref:Protein HflK n=2 Tax=Paenibacillus albiflavus TaxID=2545760 RepID=A0A4R4E6I7_9BACL|nr:FtsH protease activity modulator HflK [Paenibacillus albiflavus]